MTRQLASLILCGFPLFGSACATKGFVEQQVRAAEVKLTEKATARETKLTERVDVQEVRVRETADRVAASRQAIDGATQQLKGLDTRVDDVATRATDATTRGQAARDANARLSERFARRNSYRVLETRFVYFERDQVEIRKQDINELEEVAKALKADVNAVLELQGFTDPRGNDRYNYQLARERVEAVTRYLVRSHGIELRQLRAVAMGKVELGADEKPGTPAFAQGRRVDIRLLAPWASWEDAAQTQTSEAAPAQAPTRTQAAPRESAQSTPATTVVPPVQPETPEPIQVSWTDPASAGPASPNMERDQPAAPRKILLRSGHDGTALKNGALKNGAPGSVLVEFLKSLTPEDLGGR
jgi:outer membrane protein OmpA-like peptidoglycan-associated protein